MFADWHLFLFLAEHPRLQGEDGVQHRQLRRRVLVLVVVVPLAVGGGSSEAAAAGGGPGAHMPRVSSHSRGSGTED